MIKHKLVLIFVLNVIQSNLMFASILSNDYYEKKRTLGVGYHEKDIGYTALDLKRKDTNVSNTILYLYKIAANSSLPFTNEEILRERFFIETAIGFLYPSIGGKYIQDTRLSNYSHVIGEWQYQRAVSSVMSRGLNYSNAVRVLEASEQLRNQKKRTIGIKSCKNLLSSNVYDINLIRLYLETLSSIKDFGSITNYYLSHFKKLNTDQAIFPSYMLVVKCISETYSIIGDGNTEKKIVRDYYDFLDKSFSKSSSKIINQWFDDLTKDKLLDMFVFSSKLLEDRQTRERTFAFFKRNKVFLMRRNARAGVPILKDTDMPKLYMKDFNLSNDDLKKLGQK